MADGSLCGRKLALPGRAEQPASLYLGNLLAPSTTTPVRRGKLTGPTTTCVIK